MSYEKITLSVPGLDNAIQRALDQNRVTDVAATALAEAGALVQLDGTGPLAWVGCVVNDRPETAQIDFLTVALACDAQGVPRAKANGQQVAQVFWSGVWPDQLATLGIDTVRRALMMMALGEPQPQVPIPVPAEGGPTQQDALPVATPEAHSIRSEIQAADELAAPLADVL